ncbi:MAG: hypothetical protein AAGC53_20125, partial [Actinomycetota bacterium]
DPPDDADPPADTVDDSPDDAGDDPASDTGDDPAADAGPDAAHDGGDVSGDNPDTATTPAPTTTATTRSVAAPVVALGFIPELSLRVECADRVIEAVVGNAGDTRGDVTLAVAPSSQASGASIDPATTTTVALSLPVDAEGTATEVVLVTESGDVLSREVEVDCLPPARPTPTIQVDCGAGTVRVTVTNEGGETVAIRAFIERVALLGADDVAGGEKADYVTAIAGRTTPVRVVADGVDLLRTDVDHGCEQTDVDTGLSLVCPGEEVQLRLSNTADVERTVTVRSGSTDDVVTLTAGTEVVIRHVLNEVQSLQVVSAYGDVLLDEHLDGWRCETESAVPPCDDVARSTTGVDAASVCQQVRAQLVLDCTTGTSVVDLANDGNDTARVRVSVDGVVTDDVDLASNATSTLSVPAVGVRVTVDVGADRVLATTAECRHDDDRRAAVLSGLLVALMAIVAAVVARFDPWIRV